MAYGKSEGGSDWKTLYVQTTLDAPNRRVVAIDLDSPDRANWTTVVPESDAVLQSADLVGGTSTAIYEPTVEGFDADRYAAKQVFYESTDGTEMPMFLVDALDMNVPAFSSETTSE